MLTVTRSPKNPFLTPSRARAFEAIGTFNPSVVKNAEGLHVFYRAMAEPDELRTPGRGFSTIGYAKEESDGTCSVRTQAIGATETWETYGCEDPRATFFEGKWYVFYTALGGFPFSAENIKVAVAVGDRPDHLSEKHLVTPFNAKAATLFPERINGDAVLILTAHTDRTDDHPYPTIAIARSKDIENFWNPEFWNDWHAHLSDHAFPDVRRAESEHMEVGATPLLTEHGWLFIYSHIQNYYDEHNRIFGIEALLLDRDDPQKIIGQTNFPFLVPEESYEKYGIVSNIVFPSGACLDGDMLHVYYGAADTVCASIKLSLPDLLACMNAESRDSFVTRTSDKPVITPIPEHPWESYGTMNAAAIDLNGSVHLLYRACDKDNNSTLGYARLADGIHVDERLDEPVYKPRAPFESHGTEDPRLHLSEDGKTIYLTYTGFDGSIARGVMSSLSAAQFDTKQFHWSEPHAITPEGVNDKDLCLITALPNGRAVVLHRIDPNICVEPVASLPLEGTLDRCIELMTARPGMWDGVKIGAAAPPLRLPEGWLFFYHAVGMDYAYRIGAALLDLETATVVLARTAMPIMSPVLPWEKEGVVKNVVFSCGIILREDTFYIYYGGGDSSLGVATLSKSALMKKLLPTL